MSRPALRSKAKPPPARTPEVWVREPASPRLRKARQTLFLSLVNTGLTLSVEGSSLVVHHDAAVAPQTGVRGLRIDVDYADDIAVKLQVSPTYCACEYLADTEAALRHVREQLAVLDEQRTGPRRRRCGRLGPGGAVQLRPRHRAAGRAWRWSIATLVRRLRAWRGKRENVLLDAIEAAGELPIREAADALDFEIEGAVFAVVAGIAIAARRFGLLSPLEGVDVPSRQCEGSGARWRWRGWWRAATLAPAAPPTQDESEGGLPRQHPSDQGVGHPPRQHLSLDVERTIAETVSGRRIPPAAAAIRAELTERPLYRLGRRRAVCGGWRPGSNPPVPLGDVGDDDEDAAPTGLGRLLGVLTAAGASLLRRVLERPLVLEGDPSALIDRAGWVNAHALVHLGRPVVELTLDPLALEPTDEVPPDLEAPAPAPARARTTTARRAPRSRPPAPTSNADTWVRWARRQPIADARRALLDACLSRGWQAAVAGVDLEVRRGRHQRMRVALFDPAVIEVYRARAQRWAVDSLEAALEILERELTAIGGVDLDEANAVKGREFSPGDAGLVIVDEAQQLPASVFVDRAPEPHRGASEALAGREPLDLDAAPPGPGRDLLEAWLAVRPTTGRPPVVDREKLYALRHQMLAAERAADDAAVAAEATRVFETPRPVQREAVWRAHAAARERLDRIAADLGHERVREGLDALGWAPRWPT